MSKTTEYSIHDTFAVTIAFVISGPAVVLAMILATKLDGMPTQSIDEWLRAAGTITLIAGLAGLFIDGLRWSSRLLWRGQIPFRVNLRKVLRDNLA